jgi:hypothetical protein
MRAWFFLKDIEDVPLTLIEQRYIMMYQMWKYQELWPWQWGYSDYPCYEHIQALFVMDSYQRDADEFHKGGAGKNEEAKT